MEQDVEALERLQASLYWRESSRVAVRLLQGMVFGSVLLSGLMCRGDRAVDDSFSLR